MQGTFQIGDRTVGIGQPAFITAEIGLNHDGDPDSARQLVKAAASAGVDAVKFQVFQADAFISGDIAKAKHQKATLDSDETLFEMWQRLEFSPEVFRGLADLANKLGLIFYGSPFDAKSAELLDNLGVNVFKIASGEVTNIPLIKQIASKKHPIIMSVGMASLGEIETAVAAIREMQNEKIALLHCVANYPTDPGQVNLRRMQKLQRVFDLPIGYSDHTTSLWISIGAVAMGASFVEKHFTLDKNLPGTDHELSADPKEMKEIVEGIRSVEQAIGSGRLDLLEAEQEGRKLFRRGLVAAKTIAKGTVITSDMLCCKRPADGISPAHFEIIIGRIARCDIKIGSPITWDQV